MSNNKTWEVVFQHKKRRSLLLALFQPVPAHGSQDRGRYAGW